MAPLIAQDVDSAPLKLCREVSVSQDPHHHVAPAHISEQVSRKRGTPWRTDVPRA